MIVRLVFNMYPISILFFVFSLAHYSTINNSPMHKIISNSNEEDELQKEIEHLERRLASAKSHLMFVTYQKTKQLQS